MKRCISFVLIIVLCLSMSSCSYRANNTNTINISDRYNAYWDRITDKYKDSFYLYEVQHPIIYSNYYDYMDSSSFTKNHVEEFYALFKESKLYASYYRKSKCYNVTTPAIAAQTDAKLFYFDDLYGYIGAPYIVIDNKPYKLCNRYGASTLCNVAPWDYDNDGNVDILTLIHNGSGLPRFEIYLFNAKTKKYTLICDSYGFNTFYPRPLPNFPLPIKTEPRKLYVFFSVFLRMINKNHETMNNLFSSLKLI